MFARRFRKPDVPWPPGALLVGGAVRDLLLGREPGDYDWLVPDPAAAAGWLAAAAGGSAFQVDSERGYWRVAGGAAEHDLVPLPPGGLESDLARRDFTVNAIALNESGSLRDPLGGRADLRRRLLRAPSRHNLREDPLRVLRAVRLATSLRLRIEEGTASWIREVAGGLREGDLAEPAPERVRDELTAIMEGELPADALDLAERLGLLDVFLPELAAGRDIEQPAMHHLDVLGHSIEALRRLTATFPDADLATRWATLLHDVGKPACRSWDHARQRWSYFGHDQAGAEIARAIMERLRYPHALRDRVAALVDRHMAQLPAAERPARRFAHRNRQLLPELLQLMLADREAARGPRSSTGSRLAYQRAMSLVLGALQQGGPPAPLLDGRQIMQHLGLEPGPAVGRAVAFLAEAQAVGDAADEEGARAALTRWARAQGISRNEN
ncbi:MAG TPA: HD domain-containing protein [Deinococcales bacterium]|nr:HD domain-containing protein [Deinococcales bacterium]